MTLRNTLVSCLAALSIASPFACSEQEHKPAKQLQPGTTQYKGRKPSVNKRKVAARKPPARKHYAATRKPSIKKQPDFEDRQYEQEKEVKRGEIDIKNISLRNGSAEDGCESAESFRRNTLFTLINRFSTVDLQDSPLEQIVHLHKGEALSEVIDKRDIPYTEYKSGQASTTIFVEKDQQIGRHTLEVVLKEKKSGTTASYKVPITFTEEDYFRISSLEICEKIRKGECVGESNSIPHDKSSFYLRAVVEYDEPKMDELRERGKLRIKGKYALLRHSSLPPIGEGKLRHKVKRSSERKGIIITKKVKMKKKYPMASYTLALELEQPDTGMRTEKKLTLNRVGIRISDFKFCTPEKFGDNYCWEDKASFRQQLGQPLKLYASATVSSFTGSSHHVYVKPTIKCKGSDSIDYPSQNFTVNTERTWERISFPVSFQKLNLEPGTEYNVDLFPYCNVTLSVVGGQNEMRKKKKFRLKKGWGSFHVEVPSSTLASRVEGVISGSGIHKRFWQSYTGTGHHYVGKLDGNFFIQLNPGSYEVLFDTIRSGPYHYHALACNITIRPGRTTSINWGGYASGYAQVSQQIPRNCRKGSYMGASGGGYDASSGSSGSSGSYVGSGGHVGGSSSSSSRRRSLADRVIDRGIDVVTPESKGATRDMQRAATKILLDPSTKRTGGHFKNLMDAAKKIGEGEE